MPKFKIIPTELEGVVIIQPTVYPDERGFLSESYVKSSFDELGISFNAVLEIDSFSAKKGVLRGLHYQLNNPQAKLVRIIKGSILDVAVDIRYGSPTFGKYISVVLSDQNHRQLFIPRGFAHGIVALEDNTHMFYKMDNEYDPNDQRGVVWNDPTIAIDWKLSEFGIAQPLLSPKDEANPTLASLAPDALPPYQV